MTFFEKDLEQIIYEADKDLLHDKGLLLKGKLFRQFRVGNYGVIDLLSVERPLYVHPIDTFQKGTITVYELKREKISLSSFIQAVRYAKGVYRYLEKRDKLHLFNIEISLIGKTIDAQSDFIYLADLFSLDENMIYIDNSTNTFVSFYTYDYDLEGLRFKSHRDYRLKNEGFNL